MSRLAITFVENVWKESIGIKEVKQEKQEEKLKIEKTHELNYAPKKMTHI